MIEQWLDLDEEQLIEIKKYWDLYEKNPEYGDYNHGKQFASFINNYYRGDKLHPSILELGFGGGKFLGQMRELKWRTYGIEIYTSICEKEVNTCIAPIWDMPYKDKIFDAIASFDVFEHLLEKDILDSFKEVKRVLKDGGTFILKVAYNQSGETGVNEELLHPIVKSVLWWKRQLSKVFDDVQLIQSIYVIKN